ncbi:hypothetical protein HQQ80_00950 [Microbacteriaceae bacterium VKM Ac-2855]|nr:hypothetical protein [Microbacteriaceae bacterium VKM Ac-2855]
MTTARAVSAGRTASTLIIVPATTDPWSRLTAPTERISTVASTGMISSEALTAADSGVAT